MIDDDANEATHGDAKPEEDKREWLNKGGEQFEKALAYMKAGGNIQTIEKKYKLSKEVKSLLTK